jgi:hypothetical protein
MHKANMLLIVSKFMVKIVFTLGNFGLFYIKSSADDKKNSNAGFKWVLSGRYQGNKGSDAADI